MKYQIQTGVHIHSAFLNWLFPLLELLFVRMQASAALSFYFRHLFAKVLLCTLFSNFSFDSFLLLCIVNLKDTSPIFLLSNICKVLLLLYFLTFINLFCIFICNDTSLCSFFVFIEWLLQTFPCFSELYCLPIFLIQSLQKGEDRFKCLVMPLCRFSFLLNYTSVLYSELYFLPIKLFLNYLKQF